MIILKKNELKNIPLFENNDKKEQVLNFTKEVIKQFQPDKIILFGSYAYGNPTSDSDIDLLIVMPFEGRNVNKAIEISCKIKRNFPMDLLVRKPEELKKRIELGDYFITEIIQKGKVLYERIN